MNLYYHYSMYLDKDALLLKYNQTREPELREEIVTAYASLVAYIARKLAFNRHDIDDLIQVGNIGLLKSIERYEPAKDIDFSTYATPTIIGEIKHYFRDKSHLVKVPRKIQEQYSKIRTHIRKITQEKGRSPTVPEIAKGLNIDEETVLECLEASQATNVVSLDAPAFDRSTSDGDSPSLLDGLGIDDGEDSLLDRETLNQALVTLDERERKILMLRYYKGLTQAEIAEKLGLSQMHISRLLSKSIKSLKSAIASQSD